MDVRVTEVRGPGKPVKGTFSGLVKSGSEGGELKITEGVFSVIRARPPRE